MTEKDDPIISSSHLMVELLRVLAGRKNHSFTRLGLNNKEGTAFRSRRLQLNFFRIQSYSIILCIEQLIHSVFTCSCTGCMSHFLLEHKQDEKNWNLCKYMYFQWTVLIHKSSVPQTSTGRLNVDKQLLRSASKQQQPIIVALRLLPIHQQEHLFSLIRVRTARWWM